jgi:cyclopropane fatty-acyl-phospholipid synthase-like methyltransferase
MINAGQYEQRLGSYWLTKVPDVAARLEQGARVLDIGCGGGAVGIAIAKTFPKCEVIGLDPDAASIRQARHSDEAAGVSDRVHFVPQTTKDYQADGGLT